MGQADKKELTFREPKGTVLMHGGNVRIFYSDNNYYDIHLDHDYKEELVIRASGSHSHGIVVIPEYSNQLRVRPE